MINEENAIEKVRKIVGATDPSKADFGTIRGDLSTDSMEIADSEGRMVDNLLHASGNKDEFNQEIKIWFGQDIYNKYHY